VVESARDSKVTQLANTIFSNENILRLYISMQNIFVMHGHDGHDNVSKGAQNLICGHLDI